MRAAIEVALFSAAIGSHAVVHHELELARVVAVREDPDVAATGDRDAGVERRLEARALVRDRRRLWRLALLPAGVLRRRVAGGKRRAERDVVLFHQAKHVRGAGVAMLDGLDTGQHRAAHAFSRRRVRGHRPSAAARGVDDRLQLLE